MKEENTVRLLKANEIECRIGQIYEHGLTLLLYKDARVDQKILDETYGPMGWQRSHQTIDGNLYCTVKVWDDSKKMWIAKQDVGTMAFSEKEKSQASDSFKRSCVNWGVGRELYSAPFIWIQASKVDIIREGSRLITKERFYVADIQYTEEREIAYLHIKNASNQSVYKWGKPECKEEFHGISEEQMNILRKELARTGVAIEAVLKRYKLERKEDMTEVIYKKAISDLKKTKSFEKVA